VEQQKKVTKEKQTFHFSWSYELRLSPGMIFQSVREHKYYGFTYVKNEFSSNNIAMKFVQAQPTHDFASGY
jgi:hypothetical protein